MITDSKLKMNNHTVKNLTKLEICFMERDICFIAMPYVLYLTLICSHLHSHCWSSTASDQMGWTVSRN